MNAIKHAILGAVAGVAPDVMLVVFGWRKTWLPKNHPFVRVHKFLHSGRGAFVVFLFGWISHIVADRASKHRTAPDV